MMELLYKRRVLVLALITILAFGLRFYRLDAAGLSEDEAHKIEAVRAYQQGNYTANAEHPMLMKLLVTASVNTIERFNLPVSIETAMRLPNVLFGSLTVIVMYLFFSHMFGFRVGLLSAIIWAINIHSIMVSRVVKEDSLLVFFTWLGYYFCRRAKFFDEAKVKVKDLYFGLTGMSFGFMLASKFFLHYAGLNFLYYHLLGETEWNKKIRARYLIIFFIVFGVVFLLANPVFLFPGIIKYMVAYLHEQTQTHHGYWMMGKLYLNDASDISGGTPLYFYLLALAVKTPLPMLAVFLLGLFEIFSKRNDENYFFLKFTFLIWIVPFSLFGAKWMRYILSLMPMFCAIAALGISVNYDRFRAWRTARRGDFTGPIKSFAAAALVIFCIVLPTVSAIRYAPFYSLYVNLIGGGKNHIGYYFPHDEFYDLGMREAIEHIAKEGEPNAVVANEAPSVVNYYKEVYGRRDLQSAIMSEQDFKFSEGVPTYVLLQDGRRYFENKSTLEFVEANYQPIKEVRVYGAAAVKIYKIRSDDENVEARRRNGERRTANGERVGKAD